jgi:hypothetical protein
VSRVRTHGDRLVTQLMSDVEEGGEAAQANELSYRRGYTHGYSQAMDDLQAGTFPPLWKKVCAFFDGALAKWRYAKGKLGHSFPPSYRSGLKKDM